ncbi:MAG TPA: hypothetical protein VEI02_04750, partial [Planctomycetota bacterium]|nr:hypothetical protein [Planctomycetota bacterium]
MTLFERLRPAAVGLFAAGLAARLATPEASPGDPIARMLLLSGAGWILLDAAARGRPTAPWWALALPWTLLAAAKPWDQDAVGAAAELFAAAIAGFAARTLAADGQGGAVRRALAALFGLAAAFAVAQTLYLRAEAEAVARAAGDPLFATAQAQAFLASRRGFATFGSPNAFAGA